MAPGSPGARRPRRRPGLALGAGSYPPDGPCSGWPSRVWRPPGSSEACTGPGRRLQPGTGSLRRSPSRPRRRGRTTMRGGAKRRSPQEDGAKLAGVPAPSGKRPLRTLRSVRADGPVQASRATRQVGQATAARRSLAGRPPPRTGAEEFGDHDQRAGAPSAPTHSKRFGNPLPDREALCWREQQPLNRSNIVGDRLMGSRHAPAHPDVGF